MVVILKPPWRCRLFGFLALPLRTNPLFSLQSRFVATIGHNWQQ
jgi:hypothetical protein